MPNPAAARNLRKVTPGAEAAVPAPDYPRTMHGPSANSRAKAVLALETRAAAAATGGLADLGAALNAGAYPSEETPLFGARIGDTTGLGAILFIFQARRRSCFTEGAAKSKAKATKRQSRHNLITCTLI